MKPLDAAYSTWPVASTSSAQVAFNSYKHKTYVKWCFPSLYISNSGPIAENNGPLDQKEMGVQVNSTRTPHYRLLINNSSQLPQSRVVSLVMVQVTPSEQLTT